MRLPRRPSTRPDGPTAAAIAGSALMAAASVAVGALGLPGMGSDVPAARAAGAAPAGAVVLSRESRVPVRMRPAPAAGQRS